MPLSNILLPIVPTHPGNNLRSDSGVFGPDAENFVDQLESDRRLPPHADEVWEATMKEIRAGTAGPLVPRDAMDQFLGFGRWRPFPRHVVWQTQKWRPIDDGKRPHTDAFTTMCETIVCIPPEFVPFTIRRLVCSLKDKVGELPDWFQPVMSAEGWWKRYRQFSPFRSTWALPSWRPCTLKPVSGITPNSRGCRLDLLHP